MSRRSLAVTCAYRLTIAAFDQPMTFITARSLPDPEGQQGRGRGRHGDQRSRAARCRWLTSEGSFSMFIGSGHATPPRTVLIWPQAGASGGECCHADRDEQSGQVDAELGDVAGGWLGR